MTGGRGLNGFALKMIAMASMAVDHAGYVLFPQHRILRYIGRLAFPIYCFLLVEGLFHTRDVKKYLGRLFVFSLISEIPYDLAFYGTIFYPQKQNVFLTLFLGLLLIAFLQREGRALLRLLAAGCCISVAWWLGTDYGGFGIMMILCFYLFREREVAKCLSFSAVTLLMRNSIQNYAILAMVPIGLYNGERGPGMKYGAYLFYPIHLLALYAIDLAWFQGG